MPGARWLHDADTLGGADALDEHLNRLPVEPGGGRQQLQATSDVHRRPALVEHLLDQGAQGAR
uniref:hypothetical protein n=1 Tax=Actinomadura montaniterrae TaxID=1803903 RepID=UPI001CEF794F|nr:hypothetical protein [Actinomadura montaniterrae]